jgi:hypothetical protein
MHEIRVAVIENALSNPGRITPQLYEDHLDRVGRGWVCEIDGRVIGFSFAARANFRYGHYSCFRNMKDVALESSC